MVRDPFANSFDDGKRQAFVYFAVNQNEITVSDYKNTIGPVHKTAIHYATACILRSEAALRTQS